MALIRVAQYGSTPTVVGDYQAQNAHLQAFTNQLMTQQFILDAGTAQPVIKQGCYVSHGGSLYIADADTSITGSPSDGSVYIRVSGTTSLTVEFVTDISGYAWNPVYTALTSGSYTLLPYLIIKASSVWTRYNFNPNNQSFGAIKAANYVTTVVANATSVDTVVNTGFYILGDTPTGTPAGCAYGQMVVIRIGTSSVIAQQIFAIHGDMYYRTGNSSDVGGAGTWGAWKRVTQSDQNLRTTDNVSFANLNPPVDNNDNSMPNIGIGGFTFGFVATSSGTVTLPPYGTMMVVTFSGSTFERSLSGRKSGGATLSFGDVNNYVFAWRIA